MIKEKTQKHEKENPCENRKISLSLKKDECANLEQKSDDQ
jgi:hypothetical protein